jgi:hypothetical protein
VASQAAESKKGKKGKADEFVPYRDSVSFWFWVAGLEESGEEAL